MIYVHFHFRTGNFKLRLGEWEAQAVTEQNPYVEFRPKALAMHPNFNAQNLQNDIALVRLNGTAPVATAPNINTACLPTMMPATGTR